MSHFYNQCQRYHGQNVTLTCRDGSRHTGRIVRVTPRTVYIQPSGGRQLGGFGYGFYGGYYGRGYSPVAVPLAFITGIVLGGLLFW
ncbi:MULTISPECIES: hypothetical protein [Bacillus]|uniref:hypothetical protein n=1 Tax=Bacillus TaxID=1386 RepID=UPI000BB77079|nr:MULTISPECIES: hypothetical protein [Bacillus]